MTRTFLKTPLLLSSTHLWLSVPALGRSGLRKHSFSLDSRTYRDKPNGDIDYENPYLDHRCVSSFSCSYEDQCHASLLLLLLR